MPNPLVVGLTGGIGSGKSTVSQLFEQLGTPVIDTDIIAREVVSPGTSALEQITEKLGDEMLTTSGELNRGKLRRLVFNDTQLKTWLESLLHPLIRAAIKKELAMINSAYCLLVVPLLVEKYPYPFVNRVLVVDTTPELQLTRAMQRDNANVAEINAIINHQATREQRLAVANDVIENLTGLANLEKQVLQLHEYYQRFSKVHHT